MPQRITWGEETNEITVEGIWNNKYVPDLWAVADSVKCDGCAKPPSWRLT